MLLHESRRAARTSPTGEIILLDDQDRSLWNREQIAEGEALVQRALASRRVRAVHAAGGDRGRACRCGRRPAATDWAQIVALYDLLSRIVPSPVVELNRAVAVAMRDGPAAGLELDRRHSGPRRFGRLPPGPRGPGRSVPPAGPDGRRPGGLRAGAGPGAAGARAAVSWRGGWRNWPEKVIFWPRCRLPVEATRLLSVRTCRFRPTPRDYRL